MENYVYSSPEMQEKIEAYLPRITEHRRDLLVKVVQNRTRHFCMVLEDLFDPHNISAVIRTAEVFGLEDEHLPAQKAHGLHGASAKKRIPHRRGEHQHEQLRLRPGSFPADRFLSRQ